MTTEDVRNAKGAARMVAKMLELASGEAPPTDHEDQVDRMLGTLFAARQAAEQFDWPLEAVHEHLSTAIALWRSADFIGPEGNA